MDPSKKYTETRREFLKTIGVGAAALTLPGYTFSCGRSANRPNIIFIMTDDHASQAISCYGFFLTIKKSYELFLCSCPLKVRVIASFLRARAALFLKLPDAFHNLTTYLPIEVF